MAADEPRRLDLHRSQYIALLSLLTKNPASVGVNACPPHIQNHQSRRRVLSFSRESHLAEALAFIAGISDSSDHVVALCLEEMSSAAGIRVVIAVNRLTYADPSDAGILNRIKSGLQAIFHLLSRASREHDPALEEPIFDAIIDLCRNRILSRIRSQRKDSSYSKSKQFVGSSLQTILSSVRKHTFPKGDRPEVDSFMRQTEGLLKVAREVEACQLKDLNRSLKRLIVTACSMHRGKNAVDIEAVLGQLGSNELDPSTTRWMTAFVRKLARYRECSGYLFRITRKMNLFENAVVFPVSLDKGCFTRQGGNLGQPCLDSCIAQCREGAGISANAKTRKNVTTALEHLGGAAFLPALQKIVKESRVHAEVQIVAHYELHPAAIQPRIIKSSKDACYLCHTFIREHGKFFTPRTHGRLYNGWRIPNVVGLNQAQVRLNRALQVRIWRGALDYVQTEEVQGLISVNESDVGSLSSMSSLGSFGLLAEKVTANKPPIGGGMPSIGEVSLSKKAKASESSVPGEPSRKGKKKEVLGRGESATTTLQPIQEEDIPAATPRPEVGSSPDQHPSRIPLVEPVEIPDGKPPGEQTPSCNQQPVAEEIQPTPEAIIADQDVQPETSQSSLPSSEDQGRSQDASTPEEAGDGQLATAQTSPESEQEPESERDPDLESKAHQSGRESRLEAEPESLSEEEVGSDLEPPPPAEILIPSSGDSSSQNYLTQDPKPPSSDPKATSGTSHTQSPSRTSPNPTLEHDPVENRTSKRVEEERQDDQAKRILIQGEPSICILSGRKMSEIPIYRNGRNGKLVVHPEYIITRTSSSSRSNGDTVELRITWLLPSLSPSPSISPPPSLSSSRSSSPPSSSSSSPSQSGPQQQRRSLKSSQRQRQRQNNQLQEQKLVDEDKRKDKGKGKGKGRIPEFLAESIPTCEDLDTGSTDFVRLIEADGEAVLVEVIRT